VVAGNTGVARIARIYRNDKGVFTDIGAAALTGVDVCSTAWGDYDTDGDLDLLLAGYTGAAYITRLYRNASGVFVDTGAGLIGVGDCSVAWGDYDNDGDLDILLAGWSGAYQTRVYRNDIGAFVDSGAGLPGARYASLAWGDFNNDGHLDLLLVGDTGVGRITKLYRNNGAIPNTPPTAPSSLAVESVSPAGAILTWTSATDAQTPWRELSYNLRIGTIPGGEDVKPAMADTASGLRRLPALGNVQQILRWLVRGLSPTGYYQVAVQAVDSAWAGGEWSDEITVRLADYPVVITRPVTNIGVNSALCGGEVTDEGASAVTSKGLVWHTTQGPTLTNYTGKSDLGPGGGSFEYKMTNLVAHQTYFVRAYAVNDKGVSYGEDQRFTTLAEWCTDIGAPLLGVKDGAALWGDFDNDGDLDILLVGNLAPTRLYRNDEGAFTNVAASFVAMNYASAAWGDYDNDGDLDLFLCGLAITVRTSKLYRNEGGGKFVEVSVVVPGVYLGSAAWGDYDNDGDLDLVLTGNTGAARITKIFRNDNGIFRDSEISLTGLSESSVAWGDYDGDRDVDILLAGYTGSAVAAKVYRVNCGDPNTPPQAPTGLVVEDLGSEIRLTWNAAADAETPTTGLSYNLRISTASGLDNIKPAMAAAINGYRRIPALGNTQMRTGWIVKGLPRGINYFWSVQAVDSAWIGGAWASERLIRLSSASMDWYADCARQDDEGSGWSWETAKKTIQAALSETRDGDRVWVAEGTYDLGGMPAPGSSLLNRVCVTNAVTVRSVAGPERTFVAGVPPDGTNDPVRCVYAGANALLAGFTLTAGRTAESGSVPWDTSGGGALLTDGVLSNCIIRLNTAHDDGGGATIWGGGRIELSWIEDNSVLTGRGGGVYLHNGGTVCGCLIAHNSASTGGGGAYLSGPNGTVENSTLVVNNADEGGGVFCSAGGTVLNGIIWDNSATTAGSNWVAKGGGTFAFCATRPITGLPGGQGCIEEDPRFKNHAEGNYRLRYGSPCIDSGSNLAAVISFDLDGTTRPLDGNDDGTATFDMGAYEYDLLTADSNGDGIPDWWYHRYSLDPNDPEVSNGNPDGDAYSTGQEYIADTDPTNAASFFSIESVSNAPVWTVWFRSSAQRPYRLLYTATLTNIQWFAVEGQSNVWGNGELLGLRDPEEAVTNRYYRVGISLP
ncbi:MAG: FG-GAP-like repeat-containing protein, partial [Kiritimatiellia bacterium]